MGSFTWSFHIIDYYSPWIRNQSPAAAGNMPNSHVSVDILDDYSGVNINSIDAYVDGYQVFNGPSTFISPFDGPASSIVPTVVDGYDGYCLVLDRTIDFNLNSEHITRIVCNDNYGNSFDGYWNFAICNTIESLTQTLYEITFDVLFSGDMTIDAELVNPANYVFSLGAYARYVDVLAANRVRLWTELIYGTETYTLTVYNITDSYGGTLPVEYNTAFILPFYSGADLSNTTGKVRTWRQSHFIQADTYRAYLAGTKGLDVFRKVSSVSYSRWGQIFDEYGISAMFLANFPTDLPITDVIPPFLQNQVPLPGGAAPPNTTIVFDVVDATTTVEITAVTVYVSGVVAFSGGYGGWFNGYSGNIVIGHKRLTFTLWPESNFSVGLVSVRITASDLFGNNLNTSYVFHIV